MRSTSDTEFATVIRRYAVSRTRDIRHSRLAAGRGIPEAVRERIFDPFFTTKEVGRGTGQGLAIARSVVREKHGGELSFDTETGKGTTFFIRLPSTARSRASPR